MRNHLFVWLLVCAGALPTPAFDIVRAGAPRAAIVLPEGASPVAQYAAHELQWHIERATSVRLPIVPERLAREWTTRIYLGACIATAEAGLHPAELPANAFQIKVTRNALFLAGRDDAGWRGVGDDVRSMGTLFAVYEWLDTQLGVKWLWPGELGTVVPPRDRIAVEESRERMFVPPFLHTKLRYGGGPVLGNWRGVISREARDKFIHDTAVWLRRHRFARPVSFEYGHAFTTYWERFGSEHPEWFALRPDGQRGPIDGAHELVQMCVSNPDLHRQIIADWLEQRKRHPSLPWINGAENDKRPEDPACTCASCRAWDSPRPLASAQNVYLVESTRPKQTAPPAHSLSDRYAKFWLALQAEGRKHDPEATVVGYAYADYSEPPVETKLNDHIIVWIVPPYRFPLGPAERNRFRNLWEGWARTGARLVLRPNYFLEGYCLPYVFARQFGTEFRYAWQHGLIGTDFDSLTSMWAAQGPNLYMLGRIQAKPWLRVDTILGEYDAGFGRAARHVRAYFLHWEGVTRQTHALHRSSFGNFQDVAGPVFTPDTFRQGRALLDRAARAVAHDPVASARVAFLRKGCDHADLSLQTVAAFQAYRKSPDDEQLRERFLIALRTLDQYRQRIERDHVADLVYAAWCENRSGFDRQQIQLLGRYEKITPLPLFWAFQWDEKEVGQAEQWYEENHDTSSWLQARTDRPWEQQDVGAEWKQRHGRDYDGVAWYRTTFTLPETARGRKLHLYFGAVDEACHVWLNGRQILVRPYNAAVNPDSWQEAFTVEITPVARFGSSNTVVVRVEDRAGAGGIWKPCAVVAE